MTILLDKQHILKAYGEAVLKDLDPLEYLVKEQLKQMVEYLRDECDIGEHPIADDAINNGRYFIMPPRVWQSLLNEVKDD